MEWEMSSKMVAAVIPLIMIHVGLMIYALNRINKNRRPRYLPAIAWVVIVIFVNIFGSLAYLILEKKHDYDKNR